MHRSRLYRLWRILERVRQGRYPNARTLADELEVSQRTILRDLDLLRDDWGAPLEFDQRRRGFFLSDPGWMPPVQDTGGQRLTAGEALALVLAVQALDALLGHGLEEAFRALLRRLPDLLPESVSVDLQSVARDISFSFAPPRGDPDVVASRMSVLREAIEQCRVVEMRYYTATRDEETTRQLEPYHLRYHEGAWYVVGYCRRRQAVRTFAVDRIRDCCLLEETFTPPTPERFSPETYFGEAWRLQRGDERQQVVVRFSPEQARFVRHRVWHPTQEAVDEPGGHLVLTFHVLGLDEIRRWLLQFGSAVEVLEPPTLRRTLAEEARRMMLLYNDETPEHQQRDLQAG